MKEIEKQIVSKFLERDLQLNFDGNEADYQKLIIDEVEKKDGIYQVSYNISIHVNRSIFKNDEDSEPEIECNYSVSITDLLIENANRDNVFEDIEENNIAIEIQHKLNK